MSPVLVRSDDPSTTHRDRRRLVAATVALSVAIAAMLAGLGALLHGPGRVDRVTVENRSSYLVDVDVAGAGHDGWLGLTATRPQERIDVHDVIDQGDRWTFHFSSGSHDGGEVEVTRAELERTGWRVTVPPAVESRLGAAGAQPYAG